MKNYILTILIVLGLGILTSPLVSNAKADVTPEILPETEQSIEDVTLSAKDEIKKQDVNEIATTANITTPVRTYRSTATSTGNTGRNYTVTKTVGGIVAHPSYSDIYRTGNLVYAHNSSNLFGNLSNLGLGATFTLTENGATTTYRVAAVKIFKKADASTLQLCNNGYDNCSGSYMSTLVNNGFYHNVALMTCTGTALGNGDATHRLVVLADRV